MKWLFLTDRFYYSLAIIVALMILSLAWIGFLYLAYLLLFIFIGVIVYEYLLLYMSGENITLERSLDSRFSNGEENEIFLKVKNDSNLEFRVTIIEELPFEFQVRDKSWNIRLKSQSEENLSYFITPVKRGKYSFGYTLGYISHFAYLLTRRIKSKEEKSEIKVYPAYKNLRLTEFLAIQSYQKTGHKKRRKLGHSMEFEQILDYVPGDNPRHINWKAAARTGTLMTNHFSEEIDNRIYLCIDMGRHMESPFEEMTLLDYAINSCISLTFVAYKKNDKMGLMTFNEKAHDFLPAVRSEKGIKQMMEMLYYQKTSFLESNYPLFYQNIRQKIKQRSLIILFTNFHSLDSMRRQLPYFKRISESHLLLIVFFRNTELESFVRRKRSSQEKIYDAVIAEEILRESREIKTELSKYGIHSLLTRPQDLRVELINSYLEIKDLGVL